MSNKNEGEFEKFWKIVTKRKTPEILIAIVIVMSVAISNWNMITSALSFVTLKAKYVFHVQPSADECKLERNAFMAGLYMNEMLSHKGSYQDHVNSTLSSRHSLLKCFEALGFSGKEILTARNMANHSASENILSELEVREKFEGHLENLGSQYKQLFAVGFYLSALITELGASELNESMIKNHTNKILTVWNEAQENIPFRLPSLKLNEHKFDKQIVSQETLKDSLDSMDIIKNFFHVNT